MESFGLSPDMIRVAGRQLRARGMWLPVMQSLAAPQISVVDHEASYPSTAELARPGIAWLNQTL